MTFSRKPRGLPWTMAAPPRYKASFKANARVAVVSDRIHGIAVGGVSRVDTAEEKFLGQHGWKVVCFSAPVFQAVTIFFGGGGLMVDDFHGLNEKTPIFLVGLINVDDFSWVEWKTRVAASEQCLAVSMPRTKKNIFSVWHGWYVQITFNWATRHISSILNLARYKTEKLLPLPKPTEQGSDPAVWLEINQSLYQLGTISLSHGQFPAWGHVCDERKTRTR